MPTLYSYCIVHDCGSAPNPFWDVCTLAICKPKIRRVAKVGDWVAGTGAKTAPNGDLSNRLVYAMRVTEVITMEDYDIWTKRKLPKKIPDWHHRDIKRQLGDSIYDFSYGKPKLRESVHNKTNIQTDLSGINVLISKDFYYFGKNAVWLPQDLLSIACQRGHKSKSNAAQVDSFVKWVRKVGGKPNTLHGEPNMVLQCSPTATQISHNRKSSPHGKSIC